MSNVSTASQSNVRPVAGYFGFVVGALALLVVLVHFSVGPLSPQKSAAASIGEIAADVRTAAVNKLKGRSTEPAAPKATPWTTDRIAKLVAAILAGLAIFLGLASFIRREDWRPAAAAVGLGAGAMAFQALTWAVLMLVGALVLVAIIQNIGQILGD